MNSEELKINWRTKNTAEHLLNPLYRSLEEGKLRWVYTGMELKIAEAKQRKPECDYTEAESKVEVLIEVAEYLRFMFELAYQSNLATCRAEDRALNYLHLMTELKKENESLKQQLEFISS